MKFSQSLCSAAAVAAFACGVCAHGPHIKASQNNEGDQDWALNHMQEEHHIMNFDAPSFFKLHDFDGSGAWTPDEVRRLYGLDDESNAHLDEHHKEQIVHDVLALFDHENTGHITYDDWMEQIRIGRRLPDFGTGPGHHGDDEYEYEIHHYEKYHGDAEGSEELIHQEDLDHFAKHEKLEQEEARIERLERMTIVDQNIPKKFRKNAEL